MSFFEPDPELEEIREAVQDFCSEVFAEPAVRRIMATELGLDAALWQRLGTEMGAFGIAVDPDYGGMGLGLRGQAVIAEAFGATLVPGPVIGTFMLGIPAIAALADEALKSELLPPLLSGESRIAFAGPNWSAEFSPENLTVRAASDGDRWILQGRVEHVYDAPAADMLLIPAQTAAGVALFLVHVAVEGVTIEPLSMMDLTRRQGTVILQDCAGQMIADPATATPLCIKVLQTASILLAAEQVGAASRMLDMTLAYIKDRFQFGRAIGSFQAIKHRCADLFIAVEHARSVAVYAAWVGESGEGDIALAAAMAQAVCSQIYFQVGAAALQLHGGIGFTWEHPAHLYFKRAAADLPTLGNPAQHRALIADMILTNG